MMRTRPKPPSLFIRMIPSVLLRGSVPRSLPGEALRELPLHAATLPGGRVGGSFAVCRIVPEDVGVSYRVTERWLCRVPVASDVRACRCGALYSDLFNGRSICRGCRRER